MFYRINVISLRVPALRERREDLPELVHHVLGRIAAADLQVRRTTSPAEDVERPASAPADLGEHIEDVERQAIVEALQKTRYNKTAAAKLLGLSFRQLRYRIKKLKIE